MSGGNLMVWGCFLLMDVLPLLLLKGVEVLDWLSSSPDLNRIEHIWDEPGRRVRQQVDSPLTLRDLERVLVE